MQLALGLLAEQQQQREVQAARRRGQQRGAGRQLHWALSQQVMALPFLWHLVSKGHGRSSNM
jgi:hypothetical protein